jgi:hypothetical protein
MESAEKLWMKSLSKSEVGSLDDIINTGMFLRSNMLIHLNIIKFIIFII